MIFKQIREIIEGKKTQTRRITKGEAIEHYLYNGGESEWKPTVYTETASSKRIKWQVGRTYTVQPGRGQPQVYYKYVTSYTGEPECVLAHDETTYGSSPLDSAKSRASNWRHELMMNGWKPLAIQLVDLWGEFLNDIDDMDAKKEGVANVHEYKQLWESIHGEGSWYDNPYVWVLEFQAVSA